MGILKQSQNSYYNDPSDFGNYQFTSLTSIIDQFLIAYVGEEKIINKVSRVDVAFHAQRAMQELSFDTFKSIKSQEIELPPSNTMILPHDYVNYTKLSWSDSSGIKHPLYPTKFTSNPFNVLQDANGDYEFMGVTGEITDLNNSDFSTVLKPSEDWSRNSAHTNDFVGTENGVLKFTSTAFSYQGTPTGRAYAVWQKINVRNIDTLDIKGSGNAASGTGVAGAGDSVLRFGISSTPGDPTTNVLKPLPAKGTNNQITSTKVSAGQIVGPNFLNTTIGTQGYIEWSGSSSNDEEVFNIDVSAYDEVIVLVTCFTPFTATGGSSRSSTLSDISRTFEGIGDDLIKSGDSTTWTNYKSSTPSENNNDDYEDDTYWPNNQKRYGLDPQHAQTNGSFYIDNLKGLIHFSSNISGKTVILDYISDSLGTDSEMQVHKFAEEAMYKWISHAVLASKINVPEYIVNRHKKERFAAIRQAKLRLSNVKLEELTQILRGKSKHIKH